MKQLLIIGIGNEGREDDGLGWRFLEAIEDDLPRGVEIEYRYQLQVEDAELISHFRRVVFVDADARAHDAGYVFEPLAPEASPSYTSHRLAPAAVLDLARSLYGKFPECRQLGISGASFDLALGLTETAAKNLQRAVGAWRSGALDFFAFAEEPLELENQYPF